MRKTLVRLFAFAASSEIMSASPSAEKRAGVVACRTATSERGDPKAAPRALADQPLLQTGVCAPPGRHNLLPAKLLRQSFERCRAGCKAHQSPSGPLTNAIVDLPARPVTC